MNVAAIAGLVGAAVFLAVISTKLLGVVQKSTLSRRIIFVLLLLASFAPINNVMVAEYVRGVFGDFSVTTLVLLSHRANFYLFNRELVEQRSRLALMICIGAAGVVLYPMALGLGPLDPYSLGYSAYALLLVLFAVIVFGFILRLDFLVLCMALVVVAWVVPLYESRNLWDYLLDPLIFVYSVLWLLVYGYKRLRLTVSAVS